MCAYANPLDKSLQSKEPKIRILYTQKQSKNKILHS